jgi:hypothetical protein
MHDRLSHCGGRGRKQDRNPASRVRLLRWIDQAQIRRERVPATGIRPDFQSGIDWRLRVHVNEAESRRRKLGHPIGRVVHSPRGQIERVERRGECRVSDQRRGEGAQHWRGDLSRARALHRVERGERGAETVPRDLDGGGRSERVAAHGSHGPLGLSAAHKSGDLLCERPGKRREPRRGGCGGPGGRTLNDFERIVDAGEPVADVAAIRNLERRQLQRVEIVPPFLQTGCPAERNDELAGVLSALGDEAVELRPRAAGNEVIHLDPRRQMEPSGKVGRRLRLKVVRAGRVHAVCSLYELAVEGSSFWVKCSHDGLFV